MILYPLEAQSTPNVFWFSNERYYTAAVVSEVDK